MKREPKLTRPKDLSVNEWKNRHQVGAKLTAENYTNLWLFCEENNFNFNSGVNHLLKTHPSLQNND